MNYSLSEQLTGDLWIDGRPIYQKTLYRAPGTINPATSNRIDFPLPNVMKVIDYKLTADWNNPNKQSSAGEVSYWSSASLPNSLVIVNICVDQVTQNIYFYVSTADNSMAQTSAAHAFHATVFYTKTSDTPAVGG